LPIKVATILLASSYCWANKQRDMAAGGLYLKALKSISNKSV